MAPSFRLTPSQRLKTAADFDRVFRQRCSAADAFLVVYAAGSDAGPTRLGLVVGKKIGNAVVRNRWKRLIREAFRLTQHQLPAACDLVVLPRAGSEPALASLQASLVRLARKAARKLTTSRLAENEPT